MDEPKLVTIRRVALARLGEVLICCFLLDFFPFKYPLQMP